MLIAILILFAFVFLIYLASSSDRRETRVRKIDPKTGEETVEIHETTGATPAQGAARFVLACLGVIGILFMILMTIGVTSE